MNIELDRDHILGGLAEIWTEWSDWAEGLTEGDWATPSRCPGWTVQDNLAHIIGTERMLRGETAPDVEFPTDHLKNAIASGNEQWVESMRSMSGAEVLADFRTVSAQRLEHLRGHDRRGDPEGWLVTRGRGAVPPVHACAGLRLVAAPRGLSGTAGSPALNWWSTSRDGGR
ncbi:MAG: hypothetical protein CM1200mP26_24430 [Acidimicrobiales bacterium]|nr:MAG: hypothetical protein CM1200mP26_24430 [Acidimicrobiales bacterium]